MEVETQPEVQEIIRDDKGRFVQGHSGNPLGKPAGTLDWKTRFENKLKEYPVLEDGSISEKDKYEFVLDSLISLAKAKNIKAIEIVLDRLMGKSEASVRVSGSLTFEQLVKRLANDEDIDEVEQPSNTT